MADGAGMWNAARILIPVLPLLVSISAGSAAPAVSVVGATDHDALNVTWAVDQFEQSGLSLPPIRIEFHGDEEACDGYDGVFRGGTDPALIDMCSVNRLVLLHELAHAWDRYTLTDAERHQFMELRGLTVWNGSGPWKQRGVEALAEVITWGLHEDPVVSGAEEKLDAYVLLTGQEPRHRVERADPLPRAADAPLEAQPDWDEVS